MKKAIKKSSSWNLEEEVHNIANNTGWVLSKYFTYANHLTGINFQ